MANSPLILRLTNHERILAFLEAGILGDSALGCDVEVGVEAVKCRRDAGASGLYDPIPARESNVLS